MLLVVIRLKLQLLILMKLKIELLPAQLRKILLFLQKKENVLPTTKQDTQLLDWFLVIQELFVRLQLFLEAVLVDITSCFQKKMKTSLLRSS